MIGNCLFQLASQFSKNKEKLQVIFILSALLNTKEDRKRKGWYEIIGHYKRMGNVQHITRFLEGFDKNLSPCKWGMARPSLCLVEEYKERFNYLSTTKDASWQQDDIPTISVLT